MYWLHCRYKFSSKFIVPRINGNGTNIWETISDTDEIYKILVECNMNKLSMSNTSPFTTGPLVDAICQYGHNDVVDHILDGTITHTTLDLTHVTVIKELGKLIQCLQRATTSHNTPIHDMDDTITLEEYKHLF